MGENKIHPVLHRRHQNSNEMRRSKQSKTKSDSTKMKPTSKKELFETVAYGIQGAWYNWNTNEILRFCPTEAPLEVSDLLITREGITHTDYYLMGMSTGDEVYMVRGNDKGVLNAVIKVITKDTLILQLPNGNIQIFERKLDTQFADELIAAL